MPDDTTESEFNASESGIELCPNVISFQTSQGSVYERLPNGEFKRHKYDGTVYEPMEWTVFVGEEHVEVFDFIKTMSAAGVVIFFQIVQYDKDDEYLTTANTPGELLAVEGSSYDLSGWRVKNTTTGELDQVLQRPILLTPRIGTKVFEFSKNGNEYHHGDKVSDIIYVN